MRTQIRKIISKRKFKETYITTVEDLDGNVLTGVGEFQVGDKIIAWFHDKYNKAKFHKDS